MTITLRCRGDITLETYQRVAFQGEAVSLSPSAIAKIQEARNRFETLIDDDNISIYGVTTGYAQNSKTRLNAVQRKAHAAVPPGAPNVAEGDPAPTTLVRGIVFARLANFIEGHAAISPEVATAVASMLDGRALPHVPIQGQGGAGEILALSPLLSGIGVPLKEKDALSLINGSPCAAAVTADGALTQAKRLENVVRSLASAIDAYGASHQAFNPIFEELWNDPDDAWAVKSLRENLQIPDTSENQSPASFRAAPRVLGQLRRAVCQAQKAAGVMLKSVTDNPVITPDGQCLSNGGFHSAHAPAVLDALTAANASVLVLISRFATRIAERADFNNSTREDGLSPYSFLPMAILGYEEEVRTFASFTLPPGGEGGGYGVNDISSPIFSAWSKQYRSGQLLDLSLSVLDKLVYQN